MKKIIQILPILVAIHSGPALSEPVSVALKDYAFDFPTYGHEITVTGITKNFNDKLTANNYISIDDKGYTLKTLIDRMSRKDRQQFISFFNDHCVLGFTSKGCAITASGDVELDEKMRMIFRMSFVKISINDNEWSNVADQKAP